ARRHDMDPGRVAALVGEVVGVVAEHFVVEHAHGAAVDAVADRQVKDQYTAGITASDVAVHVGIGGVFDFDAGDVFHGFVMTHDNVLRLADIDTGIGGTAHIAVLDQ